MNLLRKTPFNQPSLKILFFVFLFFIFSYELFAQSIKDNITEKAIDGGIGLGSILAVVASWSRNKSILYGIIHGLLGWIYVVYFVFTDED